MKSQLICIKHNILTPADKEHRHFTK